MNATIIQDPQIRSGKPIIKGTRVTVDEILGWLAAGMDFPEIEREYGITKTQVAAAVQYVRGWTMGESVQAYALSPGR